MNRLVKISLLVLAIVFAIGGVLAFYKTIVSPPGKLDFKNQYVGSIKNDISKVKTVHSDYSIDSVYTAITHEISFQWGNSLLTDMDNDEMLESFITQYVPVYVAGCNNKFQQSVWRENELKAIQAHIRELHAITDSKGEVVIGGDAKTSLNEIHNVIVHYYDAKSAAFVGGYNGLPYAKQKISDAKRYAAMYPINNCTELVQRLSSVSARLEHAHYAYLQGQVERLSNYYYYSQSEYENLVDEISNKIEEYKKEAQSVYGRISSVSALENRAGYLYSNAVFN